MSAREKPPSSRATLAPAGAYTQSSGLTALATADRYLPGLIDVAEKGKSPKDAVALIEKQAA